jgi:hypothetical protein
MWREGLEYWTGVLTVLDGAIERLEDNCETATPGLLEARDEVKATIKRISVVLEEYELWGLGMLGKNK